MKIFNNFINKINEIEPNYINKWKYKEESFTRNRKLPSLTLSLQLFASKGKSLKNELFDFYNEFKLNGNVSSWGYSKRRLEFNPLMIHEMNHDMMRDYYNDNIKELKTFKKYFIIGVDGNDIRIPTTRENYEYFGYQKRKGYDASNEPCLASISCMYDFLNSYILDTTINPFKFSKKILVKETLKINVQ